MNPNVSPDSPFYPDFLTQAVFNIHDRNVRIKNSERLTIVNADGEIAGDGTICMVKQRDRTKFLKMYPDFWRMFINLSKSGQHVLAYLCDCISQMRQGSDIVFFESERLRASAGHIPSWNK